MKVHVLSSSLHRLRLSAVMFQGVEAAQYAVPGGVWNAVLVCKAQALLCCVRCCMWRIVGLGLRSSPLLGSCVWLLVTRLLLLLNVEGGTCGYCKIQRSSRCANLCSFQLHCLVFALKRSALWPAQRRYETCSLGEFLVAVSRQHSSSVCTFNPGSAAVSPLVDAYQRRMSRW
jgi:hypothetical protein